MTQEMLGIFYRFVSPAVQLRVITSFLTISLT